MAYQENPRAPGYWLYDGLPVNADVETHQLSLALARRWARAGVNTLDVAAGHGALSKALLDAGFAVACTSWNDNVQLPIERYRVDLDKSFDRTAVGSRRYELVCALEIIEHVENPAQLLRSIAGLMDQGGICVLSTPNVESASARLEWLLRGCPYAFDGAEIRENRHISMLWRSGLEHLIALAGFDIVEKHLSGRLRFHNRRQRLLKQPIHWLMRRLLSGDLAGASRLYLLRRNARTPHVMGADEVN